MSEAPERDEALGARLRSLRVDPPDRGFGAALHRKLVAAGPPAPSSAFEKLVVLFRRRAPVLWPALGVSLGVLTFLVLGALTPKAEPQGFAANTPPSVAPKDPVKPSPAPKEQPETELPGTSVPASKVAVIHLNFSADVEVQDASFQVSLPEGLAFYADGEELPQRSFEWSQALAAGENVIPIAVRGQKPGRYLVTAVARLGDQEVQHDVILEVTEG